MARSKELKAAIRNLEAVVRDEVWEREIKWRDEALEKRTEILQEAYRILTGENCYAPFADELGASVLRAARAQAMRTEPPTVRLAVAYIKTMRRCDVPVGGRFYRVSVGDEYRAEIAMNKPQVLSDPFCYSCLEDDESKEKHRMEGGAAVIMLCYE